jgi:nucleoside-diphosphate-sugar epimerase
MLALVTGGSGYFGTTLVRALLETGRDVRVLDLVDTDDRPPEVGLVLGDICDPSAVARSVEGVAEVYHNVAQVPLARDEKAFQRVNIEGTGVLLAASRDAGVRKVVHTSSSAVFGIPASNPVTRDTPPHPVESYGRAKLEAEQLCHRAVAEGLDVSIVRPRTIVGHGRLGIFGILFDWIADGAAVPVLGNGDNRYQFVHADDVARACLLAAERPGPATFHIGAERWWRCASTPAPARGCARCPHDPRRSQWRPPRACG